MRNLLIVCAFVGLLTSCGSVLSINDAYMSATPNPVSQPKTATVDESDNTALLSGLLGALAGDNSITASNDGTALSTDGIVSGLLGSILNSFATVDKNSILGSWNFKGSAFIFESENALASLGSDVVATQLESKVDQYLSKFNIKEGACSITFNKDGTFVFVMGDRVVNGNYSLNMETKELTMTFGMFKTVANLVYEGGLINLVYHSEGLLNMLKSIGAKGSNKTFEMFNALLSQYDGLRIGMAFAK